VVDRTSAVLLSRNHDGTEPTKVTYSDTTFTREHVYREVVGRVVSFVVDRTSAVLLSRNPNGTEATKVTYHDTTFTREHVYREVVGRVAFLWLTVRQPSCFRGTTTARKRRS
jgi:hypothetical protein